MPKYECADCKKTFIYPAKLTTTFGSNTATMNDTWETHNCPFCRSLNLLEHVEVEPAITSVKSVDLAEVDGFLKEGYVVHELYAKTATIIKKEVPK